MDTFIIKNYIKHNLKALLLKTAKLYPDKFTQTVIDAELLELEHYISGLNISFTHPNPISIPNPSLSQIQPIMPVPAASTSQQPAASQQPMPVSVPAAGTSQQPALVSNPAAGTSQQPATGTSQQPVKPRCAARVMDTKKPITKDTAGNIVYGRQCYHNALAGLEYCASHNKHRPHGNFYTEPSEILKEHFNKVSRRIK